MKKKIWSLCLLVLFTLCFAGCKKDAKESGINIYYLNNEGTGLVTVSYSFRGNTPYEQVGELLDVLSSEVVDVDYHNPISEEIQIESYDIKEKALTVHFNEEYNNLTDTSEALLRAAVVKTVIQVEGVDNVTFYIGKYPLMDVNENAVGAMTDESFLYDYGQAQSQSESEVLTLYYATVDGNNLREMKQTAHYSTTIPLEQVVLNSLTQTPEAEGIMSAIPEGTKVLSVVINDGICYVTLDSGIFNLPEGETREVAVYSIVNSLCELDTVSKVQIIVNNENDAGLLGNDEVSGTYTPNYDLVVE